MEKNKFLVLSSVFFLILIVRGPYISFNEKVKVHCESSLFIVLIDGDDIENLFLYIMFACVRKYFFPWITAF